MSHGDMNYLADQVSRLTHLLSRYQDAYPNFVVEEYGLSKADGESDKPWLVDEQFSPLLKEYDGIIYSLQEQNQKFRNEISSFKEQASDVVKENESLRRELRETVESRLSGSGGLGGEGDEAVLANLQMQLEQAVEEKETAQEKWRESAQEIDRLEAQLEMEKDSHQFRVVEKQAHQVKDQYQQSVTALTKEVDSLQNELRELRSDNSDKSQKLMELSLKVSDLQQQLVWKDQEMADNIFKEGFSDSKNSELKRIMDEMRLRLNQMTAESTELRRDNTSLMTRSSELQRRLDETEMRENEAIVQVRDAVQMVEAAVMEKDQMEIVAHQKEEEVDEMKATVTKLINKAGARTREEVDNVKKQSNERITRLTEELHALEMEGTEKQARLDRMIREKRAVESELQTLYKEGMVEGSKSKEAYQELNQRAINAEKGRDQALVKVENLQAEVDKMNMENKRLSGHLASETKQLQDRLTSVQSEFEAVDEDRLSCVDRMNALEKKLQQANQEKEAAHRKFTKDLALAEQEHQTRTRNLEVKLQTTEDTKGQTVSELRRLLNSQQRMSAKWKEECQAITHKFEVKLDDLRGEMTHVKKRNGELTSLLKESQVKLVEAERMISEYSKHIHRMEERVRETEMQAGEASKKLSRLSMRERQLNNQKETLLSELARSQNRNRETTESPLPQVVEFASSKTRGVADTSLHHSQRGELTLDQLSNSAKLHTSTGSGGR